MAVHCRFSCVQFSQYRLKRLLPETELAIDILNEVAKGKF